MQHDHNETGMDALEGESDFESFEFSDQETDNPFNEVEEMELAAELLEVGDEAELDQFLGRLIKKASRATGGFLKGPLGSTVGGLVKGAIKKALPGLGSSVGNLLAPGMGGSMGGSLAIKAGQMLGLELEGMSPEDKEFEVAKRLVRLGGASVRNAARPRRGGSPVAIGRNAVARAARRHAPGLIRVRGGEPMDDSAGCNCGSNKAGRWIRQGGKIILLNA
ncbi:MAG: hypothetical protein H0X66_12720 [Verrucomicrobia bacterium]|nr:hypothetical protein [Verrucomicrobiota bacterium]